MSILPIRPYDGVPLTAKLHPANHPRATILYLHGGGFLFGQPDDLPAPYTELLTAAGYALLALPYPLAPGATIPQIISWLGEAVPDALDKLGEAGERAVLFGRSAGGFLAMHAAAERIAVEDLRIAAVISLYGFASLELPEFSRPSPWYQRFAAIEPATLPTDTVETHGSMDERYPAYVALRQSGRWAQVVSGGNLAAVTIPNEALRRFPPTFLAHAVLDPDVPFSASSQLQRLIPQVTLERIYGIAGHDVDRDPDGPHGLPLYRRMVAWLDGRISG